MRILLEVVMLFGLLGGLFYAMHILAKESREDKALAKLEAAKEAEDMPPESKDT